MTDALAPRRIDRYTVHGPIASGGMATVRYGRLENDAFGRIVAIKELHPHLAREEDFSSVLIDEARITARIQHPNVVPISDVVVEGGELFLVMEYVAGVTLATLLREAMAIGEAIDLRIVIAIVTGVLHGLHAAHEATDEHGRALGVIHRDVSPQNVLIGEDGVPRVVDFGIAKAAGRLQQTREGQLKGKIAYMAPEQIDGSAIDRRADVYATSVLLWELLTGERLFGGMANVERIADRLLYEPPAPSTHRVGLPFAFDDVTLRGLAREPRQRFPTARAMADALEACGPRATASEVGRWVTRLAGDELAKRAEDVMRLERGSPPANGSNARPSPPARSKRRGLTLIAAGAVVSAAAITWALHGESPVSAPKSIQTNTVRTPSGTTPASSPPPPNDERHAVESHAIAESADNVPAEPVPPPPTPIPARNATHRPRAHQAACMPPYTVDSQGLRKYKVECL